ncbi:uncharacterized protein P174DRAFT_140886 [Aspergillus novofumigatus IBT 16806]|uniref:Uncharacterized protein n=1 Tax=Aspergillus novofumigatus (strain IBT 16806) TaxID=1392255 RepID=A0A2I1CDL8_ASPN1|nr:uncharacterized protein P174DRAFT_140886 [Aspergillus novofumigatus IBT 16806]PKX95709.1 hypothetical protein P174DRAFT_140886 [Aspergillus novofumigatus IBT 16806]
MIAPLGSSGIIKVTVARQPQTTWPRQRHSVLFCSFSGMRLSKGSAYHDLTTSSNSPKKRRRFHSPSRESEHLAPEVNMVPMVHSVTSTPSLPHPPDFGFSALWGRVVGENPPLSHADNVRVVSILRLLEGSMIIDWTGAAQNAPRCFRSG